METAKLATMLLIAALSLTAGFLFWRYVWFFRNPTRTTPGGESIVSPADGTVVYVKRVQPGEEVIVIKKGLAARVEDIVKEEMDSPKILIGIFMSPFNVHYNRAPLSGVVRKVSHYAAATRNLHMGPMHARTVFNIEPFYTNSRHIVENERKVTRILGEFKGSPVSCYVVQIGAKTVNGIDSYIPEGGRAQKGEIFGMIRIGSQVDLIFPSLDNIQIKVKPGDKVRAGETVLLE
jgi:phosphatidylserine decarboxylase